MDKEQILALAVEEGLKHFDNFQDDGKTLMVGEFDVTDQVQRTVLATIQHYKDSVLGEAGEPVAWLCWLDGDEEKRIPDAAITGYEPKAYKNRTPLYTSDQLIAARKPLEEEIERLKAEAEHRYVEQILSPIRLLLRVAKTAFLAADDSEEIMTDDGREYRIIGPDFDELSDALDALEELPGDRPGYVMSGPAKAAWALRDIIGETN